MSYVVAKGVLKLPRVTKGILKGLNTAIGFACGLKIIPRSLLTIKSLSNKWNAERKLGEDTGDVGLEPHIPT